MRVLSLFDGISVARVALEKAGIPAEQYYASEIDKYAIQVSKKNYPDIIEVGSVVGLDTKQFGEIDLLVGGSPCQDLSIAKKDRKGLEGSRSGLFWEYVRIRNEVKPKYFILENVNSMPKEAKATITEALGVEPIMINAALVSAQNRKRLFWVGKLNEFGTYDKLKIEQPEDRGILLRDILEEDVDEKYNFNETRTKYVLNRPKNFSVTIDPDKTNTLRTNYGNASANETYVTTKRIGQIGKGGQANRIYSPEGKSVGLSATSGGTGDKTGLYAIIPEATKKGYAVATDGQSVDLSFPNSKTRRGRVGDKVKNIMTSGNIGVFTNSIIRKLTPIECERLQSLTEVERSSIIRVCIDPQKNYATVGEKNHKLPSVAGNVEKSDLKETALCVVESLNIKNQPINKPVQPDVLISCGENTLQIHYQNKLLANVSGVDWKQSVRHLKKIEDFVHLAVGLNTIVEKIMPFGGAELLPKNNLLVAKESGNNVVSLYGKGITQLAEDAEKDLTTLKRLLMSITLDHSGQENREQLIQTLFSYVVSAIIGYIPEEIKNQNILTFQIKSKVGYTFGVSNTQRYKCLGNAFNAEVVAHIMAYLK